MKKKKIDATELIEAEAQYISLVPKGANRIPIRTLKSENGNMIQFDKLFMNKQEKQAPFISSFVVNEGGDVEAVKKQLEENGFKTDNVKKNEDGLTFFVQKEIDEDEKGQLALKLNDDLAAHVVSKYFEPMDFETTSFKELYSKAGVIPSIMTAQEVLREVILNTLYSSDIKDGPEASKKVKKALSEFSTIVTNMVENIPVSAFKMETLKVEEKSEEKTEEVKSEEAPEDKSKEQKEDLVKSEEGAEKAETTKSEDKEDEVEPVDKAEEDTDDSKAEDKSEDVKSEDKAEGVEKEADEKAESSKSEEEAEEVRKSEENKTEDMLKQIIGKISSLEESVKGLDDIKEDVSGLKTRVEEVSKIAKSADEAVNGTVNSEPEGDRLVSTKSERKQTDPLRDTGYSRIK